MIAAINGSFAGVYLRVSIRFAEENTLYIYWYIIHLENGLVHIEQRFDR